MDWAKFWLFFSITVVLMLLIAVVSEILAVNFFVMLGLVVIGFWAVVIIFLIVMIGIYIGKCQKSAKREKREGE